jgi:hypothetical protein
MQAVFFDIPAGAFSRNPMLQEWVQDGYAVAREKVGEASESVRSTVENTPAVQRIKKKVKDIRRAAEPAETYFADAVQAEEARKAEENTAEVVVEIEAGIREPQNEE